MSKSTVSPATAAMVRAFYNDPAKGAARTAALTKGAQSVAPGSRGRLHPEAIAGYNKGKPEARRYVTGTTKAAIAQAKGEAVALRAKAAAAGVEVGKRGPLPKAFLVAEGLVKPTRKVRKG